MADITQKSSVSTAAVSKPINTIPSSKPKSKSTSLLSTLASKITGSSMKVLKEMKKAEKIGDTARVLELAENLKMGKSIVKKGSVPINHMNIRQKTRRENEQKDTFHKAVTSPISSTDETNVKMQTQCNRSIEILDDSIQTSLWQEATTQNTDTTEAKTITHLKKNKKS